jgi:hypothetical protein
LVNNNFYDRKNVLTKKSKNWFFDKKNAFWKKFVF